MVFFNNYVSCLYIQLSSGNRDPNFLRMSSQKCVPSVHFVAASLYLSIFPFYFGGLDVGLIISVPEFPYLLYMCHFLDIFKTVFIKHFYFNIAASQRAHDANKMSN